MQIGVPRESRARETRVAATPKTVGQLIGLGYEVVIESGAGQLASFDDHAYAAAGARVVDAHEAWGSDIVHKVNAPTAEEIARLCPGTVLVGLLAPALSPELRAGLANRAARPALTPRELEILEQIQRGLRNREIARVCGISEETVQTHVKSILLKLEAQDRTAAVTIALNRGIIHVS